MFPPALQTSADIRPWSERQACAGHVARLHSRLNLRCLAQALIGAAVGTAIRFGYMALCASRNFLAIMVGFPCLLGAVLAAVVGSNRSPWLPGFGTRMGKGLLAGLVLGFVYMVVLNIAGGMVMTAHDDLADQTQGYVTMMWRAGPIALGLSGGLFFVLIRWALASRE
jgi:hypothetical protein